MKTLIKNANIILPDEVMENAWLTAVDGLIYDFGYGEAPEGTFDSVTDGEGLFLSPGFVDTHVHGGNGCTFYDGSAESVLTVLRTHLEGGTTTILPTMTSLPHAKYIETFKVFDSLKGKLDKMDDVPHVEGIHMEGPYCSGAALGAQNTATYRDWNMEEVGQYLEMAPLIRKWTAACERKNGMEFGRFLERKGITASIGHSNATLQEVFEAFDCGYHSITHLYSACSSYHRNGAYREGGIVEAAFLLDDMYVEMITDGVHLPKEFLQLIYKIKGAERISLITDATRWAGVKVPEGSLMQGEPGEKPVYIENGVALVENKSCFAGSIAQMNRCVRVPTKIAGIDICDAVRMATLTPAHVTGLDNMVGSIKRGKRADLLLFDDDIVIRNIFLSGRKVK